MTYPKVTTGADDQSGAAKVPASPSFPAMEERVLAFWKADDTFQASVDRNPAGENGRTSSCSTTDRPSPTACRTTGTC